MCCRKVALASAKIRGHAVGVGQPSFAIAITATIDPPLLPEDERGVRAQLEASVNGRMVLHSRNGDAEAISWASWRFAVGPGSSGMPVQLAALEVALRYAVPAPHRVTVAALEATSMAEVNRRLTSIGVPGPGEELPPTNRTLPEIPEVVSTAQFAELLGVTPARVRQMRAAAVAGETDFPPEAYPGLWLRTVAEEYVRGFGRRRRP